MSSQNKVNKKLELAKKRWIKACDKWLNLLWCTDFYVTYEFSDVGKADEQGWIAIATVTTEPRYRDTLITANPEQLVSLSSTLMDRHACHEVMHVVLSQYQEWAKDLISWIPGQGRKDVFKAVERDEIELLATRLVQIVRKIRRDAPCCHTHDAKKGKKSVIKKLKKHDG